MTEKFNQDAKVNRLQQMIEAMPICVMMCDPETLNFTYINKQARETLKEIEHLLPVKADDLMGQCIDIFHKNPEHQRRLLGDPKNLPHKASIELGDHTLSLDVSAVMGPNGEYVGPMVAWSVITDRIGMANDVAKVVEIVASASTEMQASAQTPVAAAEEVTANTQTVASSAEELASSISGISRLAAESTNIAREAVNETNRTNEAVEIVASASTEMQSSAQALAATAEISRNVTEASNGTQEVTTNIANVSTSAGESGQAAGQVLEAANGLSQNAEDMRKKIEDFMNDL